MCEKRTIRHTKLGNISSPPLFPPGIDQAHADGGQLTENVVDVPAGEAGQDLGFLLKALGPRSPDVRNIVAVLGRSISPISLSPEDLKHGMLVEGMPETIGVKPGMA